MDKHKKQMIEDAQKDFYARRAIAEILRGDDESQKTELAERLGAMFDPVAKVRFERQQPPEPFPTWTVAVTQYAREVGFGVTVISEVSANALSDLIVNANTRDLFVRQVTSALGKQAALHLKSGQKRR